MPEWFARAQNCAGQENGNPTLATLRTEYFYSTKQYLIYLFLTKTVTYEYKQCFFLQFIRRQYLVYSGKNVNIKIKMLVLMSNVGYEGSDHYKKGQTM